LNRLAVEVDELLAAKRFRSALRILRDEIRRRPSDERLVARMADVYALAARKDRAIDLLKGLTKRLARKRRTAKAIVAAKKLQQIDPSNDDEIDIMLATTLRAEPSSDEGWDRLFSPEEIEDLDIGEGWQTADPEPAEAPFQAGPVADESTIAAGAASPLFDGFTHDELVAVIRGIALLTFEPGDIIVTQGDPRDSVFILTSGTAKAFVRQDRSYTQVRELHDGDFFGEISLLSGGTRTATITAATRCELLELDRGTVEAISISHPHVTEVLQRFGEERMASDRALM
jgi:hypothetical protein